MDERVASVIEALTEIKDDNTIPKNIKTRVEQTIILLSEKEDVSVKIHKALNELDEIAEDSNIQAYTRTQIWNIVSALESL